MRTGSERARLRGRVGRAARSSSLPIELVAEWLLDGCRVEPGPAGCRGSSGAPTASSGRADLPGASSGLRSVVAAGERGQAVAGLDRVRA